MSYSLHSLNGGVYTALLRGEVWGMLGRDTWRLGYSSCIVVFESFEGRNA